MELDFLVDKKFRELVIEYKRINGRMSYLKVKSNIANITMINVYAPTEEASVEEKNVFYEELAAVCEKISKHDTLRSQVQVRGEWKRIVDRARTHSSL